MRGLHQGQSHTTDNPGEGEMLRQWAGLTPPVLGSPWGQEPLSQKGIETVKDV